MPVRRALVSVSDKTGVVDFVRALCEMGMEIVSSSGTADLLVQEGIPVRRVEAITGSPEMMSGRVKTLHPKIHAGILARVGTDDAELEAHGIERFDMVVVNLYPFAKVVAQPACTHEQAIENIDIGGPAMIRAAAKNYQHVTVVTRVEDYHWVQDQWVASNGHLDLDTRAALARQAFALTSEYDRCVSAYLNALMDEAPASLPSRFSVHLSKVQDCRYGENPHQRAALYHVEGEATTGVAHADLLAGKPLSYNNFVDADSAWKTVQQFSEPACVIVKHANPCAAAIASDLRSAFLRAYQADSVSAFGGIVAFNRHLDADTVQTILEQVFVEVIVAPSISDEARTHLAAKPQLRVLAVQAGSTDQNVEWTRLGGGVLLQSPDLALPEASECRVVSEREPSEAQWRDLMFAMRVGKMVKSNAIVLANNQSTVGVGMGQSSRVVSVKQAIEQAQRFNLALQGACMGSDAFFPFDDALVLAADAGVSAVIQPGGSKRDPEVIRAANNLGLAMVLTGVRHFRH